MSKLRGVGPVVVVDDCSDSLALTKVAFEYADIPNSLILLQSGTDLLNYLAQVRTQSAPIPSIILLDINMPTPDGHETLQRIRAQECFHDLPIIVMLTASDDAPDIEKAMRDGANGYQVKPFDFDEFIKFLSELKP